MSVYVKIRNIGPGNENLLLKGVIIRKQEPRVVQLKKGKLKILNYFLVFKSILFQINSLFFEITLFLVDINL